MADMKNMSGPKQHTIHAKSGAHMQKIANSMAGKIHKRASSPDKMVAPNTTKWMPKGFKK